MSKSSKPTFKTAQEWHIYHVFSDPDFKKEINSLSERIASKEQYQKIAAQYLIPTSEVYSYHSLAISRIVKDSPTPQDRPYSFTYDDEKHKYLIELEDSINKVSFEEIWSHIESMRLVVTTTVNMDRITRVTRSSKTTKKEKPPQETDLIYAIFKARKQNTFTWIFDKYREGSLPLYKGSTTQFKSSDSLERYYDKYKPNKSESDI
jgi:hypothetical protein